MTWPATTNPEADYYVVYRGNGDPETATAIATLAPPDTSHNDSTVTNGVTYAFWVTLVDTSGCESAKSTPDHATPSVATAVPGALGPEATRLGMNHPNPFNPATTLSYNLPSGVQVQLTVYDMRGREVATLEDAWQPAGHYRLLWDGKDRWGQRVGTGVYLARLRAGNAAMMRKMVLLR